MQIVKIFTVDIAEPEAVSQQLIAKFEIVYCIILSKLEKKFHADYAAGKKLCLLFSSTRKCSHPVLLTVRKSK